MYGKKELWITQFPHHRPEAKELNSELLSEPNPGADQGEDAGSTLPHPPPPPTNDLQFSNITGILQIYIVHYMYDMYSQQLTLCYCIVKAFFFRFANKNCLRHQSVTPFLNGAAPPKKNLGSITEIQLEVRMGLDHGTDHGIYCKSKALIARVKFQKQCGLETAF